MFYSFTHKNFSNSQPEPHVFPAREHTNCTLRVQTLDLDCFSESLCQLIATLLRASAVYCSFVVMIIAGNNHLNLDQ